MIEQKKYTFSGHESFYCKSLWLKKGYDFIAKGKNFRSDDAVIDLGVGKNMVSSIKFWMRAFDLFNEDKLTNLANYLLNNENGKDPYLEDVGTLWLLHYKLVISEVASIYKLFFIDLQKDKGDIFTKEQIQLFIKRKCSESEFTNQYNKNTVKRDIGVLLQNYVIPKQDKQIEDIALLVDLNIIRQQKQEHNEYYFNVKGKSEIPLEIFLYAIVDFKQNEQIVSFDSLLELSLIFCMNKQELLDIINSIVEKYSSYIRYTDDGGIKQLFFLKEMKKEEILNKYY